MRLRKTKTATETKATKNRRTSATAKVAPTATPQTKQTPQTATTSPDPATVEGSRDMSIRDENKIARAVAAYDLYTAYLSRLLSEFRKVCPKFSHTELANIVRHRRNEDRATAIKCAIVLANLDGEKPKIGGLTMPIERAAELVDVPNLAELVELVGTVRNDADMSLVVPSWVVPSADGSLTYDRTQIEERYTTHLTPSQAEKYRYFEGLADTLNAYLQGGGNIDIARNLLGVIWWRGLTVEYGDGIDRVSVKKFRPDVPYIVATY